MHLNFNDHLYLMIENVYEKDLNIMISITDYVLHTLIKRNTK